MQALAIAMARWVLPVPVPLDRARLLFGNLGLQQVADDCLRLVRPLHRRLDDLVEGGLHAVEPQLAHGGEDLLAFHHTALLRVS